MNDQRQAYYSGVLQGLKIARNIQEKYTGAFDEPLLYAMTALLRRRANNRPMAMESDSWVGCFIRNTTLCSPAS